jgi:SAM-dependent methyltransferase
MYEKFLNFNRSELAGLTVLDLGSGPEERFRKEIERAGIKCKVICANPDYSLSDYRGEQLREDVAGYRSSNRSSVGALGSELPFQENSFDKIFALESVSKYCPPNLYPEAANAWAQEGYRILKAGGEFKILSLPRSEQTDADWASYYEDCAQVQNLLLVTGFQVKVDRLYHPEFEKELITFNAKK